MDKDIKNFKSLDTKSDAAASVSAPANDTVKHFNASPAKVSSQSAEQFAEEYVQKLAKMEEAFKAGDKEYAKKLCDELIRLFPDLVRVQYYSYVLQGVDTVYKAYEKRYGQSRIVEQFQKDSMEECLLVFIEEIAVAEGDLERAYHGYRALGNNAKAKYTRYRQGEKAMKDGKYEDALKYFTEAEDYRDAQRQVEYLRRAAKVKPAFDAYVGDKKTFFERKLTEEMPGEMAEYQDLKRQAAACKHHYSEGGLYLACMIVMMVASIIMLFDNAECDLVPIYFVWGIAATVALHEYNVWDFRLILSCLCAFALSCAIPFAKILSNQFLGTHWIATLAGVGLTFFFFYRNVKRDADYKKYQKIEARTKELETGFLVNRQELIRTKLVSQYKAEVGETIVKAWTHDIPKFI